MSQIITVTNRGTLGGDYTATRDGNRITVRNRATTDRDWDITLNEDHVQIRNHSTIDGDYDITIKPEEVQVTNRGSLSNDYTVKLAAPISSLEYEKIALLVASSITGVPLLFLASPYAQI